ncbi:MAG: hypothetical protein M0006_11320 [Magnetospirillum sp.]|nr:hypothetical protein [Magnetospirillum sp.]
MDVSKRDEPEAAPDGLVEASYCTTVEHFFGPSSRDLIGRYLAPFLDQLIITPTELLHSAKCQKRLHDSGRTLMNAVDKIATLQARSRKESPAKRVRDLHALIGQASRKIWDDERDHPLPSVKPEGFADAVTRLPEAERGYGGNRMLADHLTQFKVWKDKIRQLVRLLDLCEGSAAFPLVETQLAEALRSNPALDQLFGIAECVEARCNDLIDLWKGAWTPRETADPVVADINALIARDRVPSVKASLEFALLRALAGKVPLRSAEPDAEIQAVFDMFRRMWTGHALIGGAKALALLEKRQARHLNAETVTDLLRDRKVLADRLLHLMTLCGLAIGTGNRETLKTFIDHYFGDRDVVPRVVAGQDPPVPKLQTLTQLHRALKGSWLPEDERAAHAGLVEAAHADLLKRSRLFEQIDKKGGGRSQKVLTLLDLHRKGTFIDGIAVDAMRRQIEIHLRDPGFTADYLQCTPGTDRDRKVALLSRTLATLGIAWTA